ncbi:metallophosphoesterase [Thalassotalea atypica]|uniref:metallophosphoesterase n=1 Tax=Thalassotalea atypica TaxID=2054316 RepID=UPI0025729DB2|nr:metallophosphoesterase [Thalassotalea atypica]
MSFIIAQISDSHLYADRHALHHGVNVYDNLANILAELSNNGEFDAVVFTGDLTQDHSERSYQHFAELILQTNLEHPVYFVAGNHDCPTLLAKHLKGEPFSSNKNITTAHWEINLVASKSESPAGYIVPSEISTLVNQALPDKYQWIFMHHHPIDVGYFIDRHHLTNQDFLWQSLQQLPLLKGIACGHVHRGMTLTKQQTGKYCDLLTCPATSIQFDTQAPTVKALAMGPGYRIIELHDNGSYRTHVHYLPDTNYSCAVKGD